MNTCESWLAALAAIGIVAACLHTLYLAGYARRRAAEEEILGRTASRFQQPRSGSR